MRPRAHAVYERNLFYQFVCHDVSVTKAFTSSNLMHNGIERANRCYRENVEHF